jgi:predicted phosphodiesterase
MRVAVITDIHSNLPALEAVLAEIADARVDQIWCLGDVVGYGAQPDECTAAVRESCDFCLVGNHDLAVLGDLDISSFSSAAAEAAIWTRDRISQSSVDFLRPLSAEGEQEGVGLFHASPRDPVWEYVLSIEQAEECMELQPQRMALIGHSHVALYFAEAVEPNGRTRAAQAGDGVRLNVSERKWVINPGSVGQPRDGDPRAAWLELDTGDADEWAVVYHRAPYDVDRAAEPIIDAGLPRHLAERLYLGQ